MLWVLLKPGRSEVASLTPPPTEGRCLMGRSLIHKKGIRSTIWAAIAAVMATIALVVVASGENSALAASSLVNGNFETGNLTGWTVDTTYGGAASAVASYDTYDRIFCPPDGSSQGGPCYELHTMFPKEGSYFALLQSGRASEYTNLYQPFE